MQTNILCGKAAQIMMQEWFRRAKLGIFIHWGLYAVDGVPESWAMASGQMSSEEYYRQTAHFTAEKYDPEEWAKYFKAAGANYAVLTTKHHEGFCLFDTEYTDLNAVKAAPCGRDLIEPYVKAMRDAGIKVGLYFTHTDWGDDDHMRVMLDMTQEEIDDMRKRKVPFYDLFVQTPAEDPEWKKELDGCWERFMKRYKGEMREVMYKFRPDLLWTDGMFVRPGFSWDSREMHDMMLDANPNAIANGRLGDYGDYETPECYIPLRPLKGEWELCTTMNNSWGHQPQDRDYKDVKKLVRMFVECISKGGNMLLSFGPDRTGALPGEVKKILLEMGEWTHKYAEAIYPTEAGVDPAYFLGGSTLSQDRRTLYLFPYDTGSGQIMINGLRNGIKRVTSMANGQELEHKILGGAWWLNIPGCRWIELPEAATDEVCTVIKVELDGPIDLVDIDMHAQSRGEGA